MNYIKLARMAYYVDKDTFKKAVINNTNALKRGNT